MSYEVHVEELDAVRRRLKITVPAREVQEEIEGAVRELARSAKVPGFRPGRVPRGVVEKRFGDRLRADVNEKLMRSSLAEALEKEHIAPLSPPEILTTPDDDDGCLRYSATVEVKPVVEAHDYHGLELDRPLAPVEPAEIDAVLERWRESQAQLDPVDERSEVQSGDVALVDFVARVDGRAMDPVEGRQVEVGSSGMPPEFDEALVGATLGTVVHARVQYPADHSEPRLAGRAVEFEITPQKIFSKRLPELDDEFAKDVGDCASLAELRDRVRTRLEAEAAKQADAAVRRAAVTALVQRHTELVLPTSMVERRLEGMIDDVRNEWKQRRIWPANESDIVPKLREQFAEQARDQVRLALVLEAISRQEGLAEVSDQEIDDAIESMIGTADVPAEQAQAYARHPDVRAGVRGRLVQSKAMDHVVERAIVTTVEKESDIADVRESV